MAKPAKKTEQASAPASAPVASPVAQFTPADRDNLTKIAEFGAVGVAVPSGVFQPLQALGYVEQIGEQSAEGTVPCKISQSGQVAIAAGAAPATPAWGAPAGAAAPAAAAAPAPAGQNKYAIVSGIAMPAKREFKRTTDYPFDDLQPGQAFFLAHVYEEDGTTVKVDAYKRLASTVASRNKSGAAMTPPKKFDIVKIDNAAPFGQPGKAGAGVWRTT